MVAIQGINATTTTTGAREDLANTITLISPDETPLFSNSTKSEAKAINHEWQTDTLDASTINSTVEGATIVTSTAAQTTRLGNILQISTRNYGVSNTLRAIALAGREDELLRLRMKKGLELRRDMEVVLHTNQAKVADTGGASVRKLGGLPTWITNNVGVDVSAGNGDGSSAIRSSGSTSLTYEFIASAQQAAFNAGGQPNMLEVPAVLKRAFSKLAYASSPGTAQLRSDIPNSAGKVMAIGTVDSWMSDFGPVDIVLNRQLTIQADSFLKQAFFLLQSDHLGIAMLRSFDVNKLAVTGDGLQEYVVSEYTLSPNAPSAHAAGYGMTA